MQQSFWKKHFFNFFYFTLLTLVVCPVIANSQELVISGYDVYGEPNGISGSIWIRGKFDFADSNGVLREEGQAQFYVRSVFCPSWSPVDNSSVGTQIYINRISYNIRRMEIRIDTASSIELKACTKDGLRCSNPATINFTPLYMGKAFDLISRTTISPDQSLKVCVSGPLKAPITMHLAITEGSLPARSDRIVDLTNISCSSNCCTGLIPASVKATEEVWDVVLSTALGNARNMPRFQYTKAIIRSTPITIPFRPMIGIH